MPLGEPLATLLSAPASSQVSPTAPQGRAWGSPPKDWETAGGFLELTVFVRVNNSDLRSEFISLSLFEFQTRWCPLSVGYKKSICMSLHSSPRCLSQPESPWPLHLQCGQQQAACVQLGECLPCSFPLHSQTSVLMLPRGGPLATCPLLLSPASSILCTNQ